MKENKVTITVIFGGASFVDDFPPRQKLAQVVRSALKAAGREGEDPATWDLKSAAGVVLSQTETILSAGLQDGAILHVVAPAGEGG